MSHSRFVLVAPLLALAGCFSSERAQHRADLEETRARVGPTPGADSSVEQILSAPPEDHASTEEALRTGPTLQKVQEAAVRRNPNAKGALERWNAYLERIPQKVTPMAPAFASRYSRMFDMLETGIITGLAFPTKLYADAKGALDEANAAREDFRALENALRAQAATAYANLWLARRKVAITEENLALLDRFLDIARTKYKTGTATLPDVLRVETERENLATDREVLAREAEIATSAFNVLLDRHPDATIGPLVALAPPAEAPPLARLYERALDVRPELRSAKERLAASEQMVSRANQEWLPDFMLGAAYVRDLANEKNFYDVSGGFSLPWLVPWAVTAKQREAEAENRRMSAEVRAQRNTVLDEVKSTHARVEAAAARHRRLTEEVIPRVRRNVEASEAAYVAGQVDFLSLIDTQRSLLVALVERESALAEWTLRRAELVRVVGGGD